MRNGEDYFNLLEYFSSCWKITPNVNFKILKNIEEIDIFEMYDIFIRQWNREPPYKDSMFVRMSAFTFLVIMDSFEAVLSQKDLPNDSALLC